MCGREMMSEKILRSPSPRQKSEKYQKIGQGASTPYYVPMQK